MLKPYVVNFTVLPMVIEHNVPFETSHIFFTNTRVIHEVMRTHP